MFPVSPEKKAIRKKLDDLGIYEKDIKESFIRSHGRGGQKVNKTSTCVYLKHIPTGTEVKCRKARTQGLNRYYARVLLLEKIECLIKVYLSVTICAFYIFLTRRHLNYLGLKCVICPKKINLGQDQKNIAFFPDLCFNIFMSQKKNCLSFSLLGFDIILQINHYIFNEA